MFESESKGMDVDKTLYAAMDNTALNAERGKLNGIIDEIETEIEAETKFNKGANIPQSLLKEISTTRKYLSIIEVLEDSRKTVSQNAPTHQDEVKDTIHTLIDAETQHKTQDREPQQPTSLPGNNQHTEVTHLVEMKQKQEIDEPNNEPSTPQTPREDLQDKRSQRTESELSDAEKAVLFAQNIARDHKDMRDATFTSLYAKARECLPAFKNDYPNSFTLPLFSWYMGFELHNKEEYDLAAYCFQYGFDQTDIKTEQGKLDKALCAQGWISSANAYMHHNPHEGVAYFHQNNQLYDQVIECFTESVERYINNGDQKHAQLFTNARDFALKVFKKYEDTHKEPSPTTISPISFIKALVESVTDTIVKQVIPKVQQNDTVTQIAKVFIDAFTI